MGIVSYGNPGKTDSLAVHTNVIEYEGFIKSVLIKRNKSIPGFYEPCPSNENGIQDGHQNGIQYGHENENGLSTPYGHENENGLSTPNGHHNEDEERFIAEGRRRKGKSHMEYDENASLKEQLLRLNRLSL